MVDLIQYEEAYNQRHRESLDATIEVALAQQGIDPECVPKRDFDQIRRLNIKLNDISMKAKAQIAKIQQEAGLENNVTILEVNLINLYLKIAQGVVRAPQVQEGHPIAAGELVIETLVEKPLDEGEESKAKVGIQPV